MPASDGMGPEIFHFEQFAGALHVKRIEYTHSYGEADDFIKTDQRNGFLDGIHSPGQTIVGGIGQSEHPVCDGLIPADKFGQGLGRSSLIPCNFQDFYYTINNAQ